jgi:3-oxoacyl-[acyl-carrier-protein] synthase II
MRESKDGRRVVVTGVGVVSVCGIGAKQYWAGLHEVPADERVRTVTDWDPGLWLEPKEVRRLDPFTQFAIAAASEALDEAGDLSAYDDSRRAVVVGTGIGGAHAYENQILIRAEKGDRRVSPFTVPMVMPNAAAAAVSMRWGWRGACETVTTACAAGTHSVAAAARLVASGRSDVALGGGAEACLTPTNLAAFTNMTALSKSGVSQPFGPGRDGFCIGEGAAVLVLEELESARTRGANVYAEIAGCGSNADAHHITAPSPGGAGAAACIRLALEDAEMSPEQVVHVNAHGTSTPLNDAAEAQALAAVFGDRQPALTSVKGVTGHSLGAAGALEAAAVALTYRNRSLPPTLGPDEADPELGPIDLVLKPRDFEPGPVLSSSFGFGGHNGCLAFRPA